MESIFNWIERLGRAGFFAQSIAAIVIIINLLLAFILARRAYRDRYFRRRNERTIAIRRAWNSILDGIMPPEGWRSDPLDCVIVEDILLDRLEVAPPEEADRLLSCLRRSGLLDMRIHAARELRGWVRQRALVSLGRMRAQEAIPALAEGLDDADAETRLAAVRGLGRMALPEGAVPILERLVQNQLSVSEWPVQNALLSCCRSRPSVLVPYIRKADDGLRPLLARVLGEVATPELHQDLLQLASDPLPEVRASAARALGEARQHLAPAALVSLATDEEWFVRLRAVVAMGELRDPATIPVLIRALCDSNRQVRLRAASALARLTAHIAEIIRLATQTRDRYALQALVSELERSGALLELLSALVDPARRCAAEQALLAALRAGAQHLLLDVMTNHANWRVRLALARLLARSGETSLVPQLELRDATTKSARQRRIIGWVLRQLRTASAPGPQPERVSA